jgi:hypothetical protein
VAEEYGVMLRPGRKPMPPPLLSPVNRLTYAQRDEQAAYIDRVEEALRAADRESKGLLATGTFERVLLQVGVTAPPRLMRDLSLSFAVPGGDRVKWPEYVAFARRLDRPCPLHKILVCPACIYPGKCDKCLCKRYACSAGAMHSFLLLNPHDATCVCGHLRARHAPAMTAHPEVDMPASFMPAMRIALGRCATLDPKAKSLAGLASPALAGFALPGVLFGEARRRGEPRRGERPGQAGPLSRRGELFAAHTPGRAPARHRGHAPPPQRLLGGHESYAA